MNREEELEIFLELTKNSKLPMISFSRLKWIIELGEIRISKVCKGLNGGLHENN